MLNASRQKVARKDWHEALPWDGGGGGAVWGWGVVGEQDRDWDRGRWVYAWKTEITHIVLTLALLLLLLLLLKEQRLRVVLHMYRKGFPFLFDGIPSISSETIIFLRNISERSTAIPQCTLLVPPTTNLLILFACGIY